MATMTLRQAIAAVRRGYAQRVVVPGEWKVWRDESGVHSLKLPPGKE